MAATKAQTPDDVDVKNASEGVEVKPKTKLQRFAEKVTPNKHTKIENFGKGFSVIAGSFLLLSTGATYTIIQNNQEHLTQQAVYATQFKTSKTQQTGTVEGVYSSKDHSKVLVMMKFDNPDQMSSMAANYQTFLAGAKQDSTPTKIKAHPSGSIIMFGQSGYMGLYLTNANGFPQQIMSAIMRADKQLVSGADNDPSSINDPRQSFQKYDQWEIFFNPGGRKAQHISSLDAPTMDVGDVYYQTVIKPLEDQQKEKLNTDLVAMKADLAAIQDYESRLSTTSVNGLHVVLPKRPSILDGDSVTGRDAVGSTPSTLMFKPKETFANGFNFDWRKLSANDRIIESLSPKGQNYVTWYTNHLKNTAQTNTFDNSDWKMSDGSSLNDLASDDVVSIQNVNRTVQSLTSAYSQYYTDKMKYQVDDLGAYLGLEMNLNDVVQNNNINSKNAINFYG